MKNFVPAMQRIKDAVITLWIQKQDCKPSGTGNTVNYAMEKGKEVYYIDAVKFRMNTYKPY